MTKLIFALILILFFSGCVIFENTPVDTPPDKISLELGCANEGEQMREYDKYLPNFCCEGLDPMLGGYNPNDCNQFFIGDISTCSDCGNGICESENQENNCTCPEDCTGEEKPCIQDFQPINVDEGEVCCHGLVPRKAGYFDENCGWEETATSKVRCLACGNNYCDNYTENKCNCPEDCG
ncbi:MAG: hypothetical protein V1672_02325 [Candidatus Diapherotrites archaeon]